jgi:hypothetical protein
MGYGIRRVAVTKFERCRQNGKITVFGKAAMTLIVIGKGLFNSEVWL